MGELAAFGSENRGTPGEERHILPDTGVTPGVPHNTQEGTMTDIGSSFVAEEDSDRLLAAFFATIQQRPPAKQRQIVCALLGVARALPDAPATNAGQTGPSYNN